MMPVRLAEGPVNSRDVDAGADGVHHGSTAAERPLIGVPQRPGELGMWPAALLPIRAPMPLLGASLGASLCVLGHLAPFDRLADSRTSR